MGERPFLPVGGRPVRRPPSRENLSSENGSRWLRPEDLAVGGCVTRATPWAPEPLLAILREGSQDPALICPDDGTVVSHAQLAASVQRLAGVLAGLGVERGERVAIVMPNGPEVVELLLAVAVLGATAAPMSSSYTHAEYAFYLSDLDPGLLLVQTGRGSDARASAGGRTVVDVSLRRDGPPVLSVAGAQATKERPFTCGSAEDVALLLHTSGTTRRPKQVPLLQRNLMASMRAIAAHYRLGAADVSYCAMPLFHVHGLIASTLAQLAVGGSVVTPRRLSQRRYWQQVSAHGVTWVSASPTIHTELIEHGTGSAPSIRFVRSCSSALAPGLMKRLEALYQAPVLEAYGMTEASHQMTSNPLPPARHEPGSVGVPAGAQVRIVDRAGRDLPAGQVGEVAVSGPGLTPGYLGDPEANAESFFGGWFRTGDRGQLRDGYLHLEGRIKELIIRGGENISPGEVEDVLKGHPAVADAVCFGIDDDKYGQVVGAAVVLTGEADTAQLRERCRASLADFKVPKVIHVVPEIPRTPTGKIQRNLVAARLTGQQR
jgi:acyl-CoA synthetase (AMP-forming)/AMP-acid ligase II